MSYDQSRTEHVNDMIMEINGMWMRLIGFFVVMGALLIVEFRVMSFVADHESLPMVLIAFFLSMFALGYAGKHLAARI